MGSVWEPTPPHGAVGEYWAGVPRRRARCRVANGGAPLWWPTSVPPIRCWPRPRGVASPPGPDTRYCFCALLLRKTIGGYIASKQGHVVDIASCRSRSWPRRRLRECSAYRVSVPTPSRDRPASHRPQPSSPLGEYGLPQMLKTGSTLIVLSGRTGYEVEPSTVRTRSGPRPSVPPKRPNLRSSQRLTGP